MKRQSLSLLILVLLLGSPLAAKELLIPLDDRPANRLFVEQIARIGNPQQPLNTPPRHLLGRLYSPGDSDALIEWADDELRAGDTLFVSIDMWLYGGLVASRTSAINTETVERRLERLRSIGGRGVTVYALATVPRLSLRTSDREASYELQLSKWATKAELPSATALLEQHAQGLTPLFPQDVPGDIVVEYLGVRKRNVDTIIDLADMCAHGYIDSLVIGQDDSNKTGIHHFEQDAIRSAIVERDISSKATLLSGIDELTMTMVSGVWAERASIAPTIRLVYSDPSAASEIPPLESLPLETMIAQHVELAGATLVQDDSADLDLYIYVPYAKPWAVPGEERRPSSEAFVRTVAEAMASGRQVAVADLSLVNRMDPFLAESALSSLTLYDLEGFASWNTPANTFGTVVSQAVCHQIAEKSPDWTLNSRLESEKTHQAFLLARFIDDYAYQTVVRAEVTDTAKGLDPNANPLLNLFGPVGVDVRLSLVNWARETFEKHYLGKSFTLVPHGVQVEFLRSKLEVALPWPRVFEVEARLDVRLGVVEKASGL